MNASTVTAVPARVTDRPLVHNANVEQAEHLSKIERICKKIADGTGAPLALGLAIAVQAVWIPVGLFTKLDPYPFAFLLTCSNVLQPILIFILEVGRRQSAGHAEQRLYHQQVQEQMLLALARKTGIEVQSVEVMLRQLATEDP